jgi:integrase
VFNSSSHGAALTLADVHVMIPQLYTGGSVLVMTSAIERAGRLAGRSLSQIPAQEAPLAAILRGLSWAGEFRGRDPNKSYDKWVAQVIGVARKAREAAVKGAGGGATQAVDPAWDAIGAYVLDAETRRDEDGKRVLPTMAWLSIANLRNRLGRVHPSRIDSATAYAALAGVADDRTASLRRSLRFFDRLIREQNRHPAIAGLLPATPVGALPMLRDAALDWTAFDPAFVAAVDEAITRTVMGGLRGAKRLAALPDDPIAAVRARRASRTKPIRNQQNARKSYHAAVSWLIRHGWPDRAEAAAALREIDDLFRPEVIARATQSYVRRADGDAALIDARETSTGPSQLARLATIAARTGMPIEVRTAIFQARCREDFDQRAELTMSRSRKAFLRLIERDEAIVKAILTAPTALEAEARRRLADWEHLGCNARIHTIKLGMAAAMIAIQLARPLRTKNLNLMTVGVEGSELLAPRRPGSAAQIVIDGRRVKNGEDIEHALPRPLWRIVAFWIDELRPKLIALHDLNDSGALFPGQNGAMSRQGFNAIWTRGLAQVGVKGLTPHMMRHVCATLYLAVKPGDYGVVADLLANTVAVVRKFYTRGQGRAAAELFARTIATLNPEAGALLRTAA